MTAEMLRREIRRVVLGQILLTLLTAGGFLLFQGGFEALSACYGGAIAIIASWWLGRRVGRAGEMALRDTNRALAWLYMGAVLRFLAALGLLILGLGVLKLAPLPLIAAFVAAQFGFLFSLGGAPRAPG